jgi:hypothetical protein
MLAVAGMVVVAEIMEMEVVRAKELDRPAAMTLLGAMPVEMVAEAVVA